MQNKPRHIDKKFTDQAWTDMQRLLDEEMPVTAQRRRFGWWWIFGMVGIVAAVALFYSVKSMMGQASPKLEEPIAEAPIKIEKTRPGAEVASTKPKVNSTPENEAETKISNVKTTAPKLLNFAKKKGTKNTQTPENQNLTIKENTLPPSILAIAETQSSPQETKLSNQPEEDLNQTSEPKRTPLILAEKIDALPLAPFAVEAPETPSIDAQYKKPRGVGLAAYAAAYVQPGRSGAGGIGAGLLANLPLGNSRFSVETGVGYAYFQQPLEVVQADLDEDAFDPQGPGNSGTVIDLNENAPYVSYDYSSESFDQLFQGNGRTSNSSEKLNLHYLNVPLEIHFRHRRWWTFAGTNTGILLASDSKLADGGIFLRNNKSTETALANEQPSTTKIRAFDFAVTGGIGFDMSPKIGIDLRYQRGLNDVLKNNGEEDINRFWRATVRWRF